MEQNLLQGEIFFKSSLGLMIFLKSYLFDEAWEGIINNSKSYSINVKAIAVLLRCTVSSTKFQGIGFLWF